MVSITEYAQNCFNTAKISDDPPNKSGKVSSYGEVFAHVPVKADSEHFNSALLLQSYSYWWLLNRSTRLSYTNSVHLTT